MRAEMDEPSDSAVKALWSYLDSRTIGGTRTFRGSSELSFVSLSRGL